jgi:hypothetical protein
MFNISYLLLLNMIASRFPSYLSSFLVYRWIIAFNLLGVSWFITASDVTLSLQLRETRSQEIQARSTMNGSHYASLGYVWYDSIDSSMISSIGNLFMYYPLNLLSLNSIGIFGSIWFDISIVGLVIFGFLVIIGNVRVIASSTLFISSFSHYSISRLSYFSLFDLFPIFPLFKIFCCGSVIFSWFIGYCYVDVIYRLCHHFLYLFWLYYSSLFTVLCLLGKVMSVINYSWW